MKTYNCFTRYTQSSVLVNFISMSLIVLMFLLIGSKVHAQSHSYYELSLEELMNIEITTSAKTSEKVSEVPASVIVITRNDIAKYGYRTLSDILEHVPGFYPIKDLSYQPNFGVRGFYNYIANRNVIFMINNVWQGNDFENSNQFASFYMPVEAIDRIEIIRGPMSVMYGSGGFYGAINIFTNENPDLENAFELSTGYGLDDRYKFLARSTGMSEDFSYSTNIAYTSIYGLDEPYSKMGSLGDIYGEGKDQRSGGRFEFNNFHFDTWASFKNLWTYFSYDHTNQETAFLFQPLKDGSGTKNYLNSLRLAVGYNSKISKMIDVSFKFNFVHNSDEYDYEIFHDAYEVQRLPSTSVIGEINAFIHPNDAIDITAGLNLHSAYDVKNTYDLPAFNLPNSVFSTSGDPIVTQAAYAQIKWRIIDPIIIVGGLRLERSLKHKLLAEEFVSTPEYIQTAEIYNQDKVLAVPRLAAIFSITPSHIVKLLYGQAINRPGFFEKVSMIGQPYPQLVEEKIKTFEINYDGMIASNFSFSFGLFRNVLSNLITRETGFDTNQDYYSIWKNYGELISTGIECRMLYEPFDDTHFDFAFTYQETSDEVFESREVAYSPHLLGYLKTSYQITPQISVALVADYVDEMLAQFDTTPVDITNPDSPVIGRLGDKTEAYFNLSATLHAEDLFWKGSNFTFNINNLFDTDIFSPTTQNSIWAPRGTLHGGRTYYLTIGSKIFGDSE